MAAASPIAGRVEPSNRLHVRNLDYSVDDEALEQAFNTAASVTKATVVQWRYSGRSRGFGFVELATLADAQTAADSLNGTDLSGRPIVVEFARSKGPRTAEEFREARAASSAFQVSTRLYVTNINETTTDEDLQEHFGAYGTVSETRIIVPRGPRPGFAFVTFEEHEAADKALLESQGVDLNGSELKIEWARASRPRGGARPARAAGGRRRRRGEESAETTTAGAPVDGDAPAKKTRAKKPKGGAAADGTAAEATAPAPPRPQNRVYVANLNLETTEVDVEALFQAYNPQEVSMGSREARKETETDRYYAFVTLAGAEEAIQAVEALNGASVGASQVRVELARAKGKGRGRGSTRGRRNRRPRGAAGAPAGAPAV